MGFVEDNSVEISNISLTHRYFTLKAKLSFNQKTDYYFSTEKRLSLT
jgi:hypothetical protein